MCEGEERRRGSYRPGAATPVWQRVLGPRVRGREVSRSSDTHPNRLSAVHLAGPEQSHRRSVQTQEESHRAQRHRRAGRGTHVVVRVVVVPARLVDLARVVEAGELAPQAKRAHLSLPSSFTFCRFCRRHSKKIDASQHNVTHTGTPKGGRRLVHLTPLLKIPVWWRRAVLPSLPWVVCFLSFFYTPPEPPKRLRLNSDACATLHTLHTTHTCTSTAHPAPCPQCRYSSITPSVPQSCHVDVP